MDNRTRSSARRNTEIGQYYDQGFDDTEFQGTAGNQPERNAAIHTNCGKEQFRKKLNPGAIFLLFDCTTPEVFFKLNRFRSKDQVNGTQDLWGRLIHSNASDFRISAVLTNGEEAVLEAAQRPERHAFYTNEFPASSSGGSPLTKPDKELSYTFRLGQASEEGMYVASPEGIRKEVHKGVASNFALPLRFVPAARNDLAMPVLLGEIELQDKKKELLTALRVVDDSVQDLVTVTQPTGPEVYIRSAAGLLPLAYAGDGLKNLAVLAMQTMSSENGIVLVDEIENGIHYSLYGQVWEILTRTAQRSGVQLICSTHSYEFVQSAFHTMEARQQADQFGLFRVDRRVRRKAVRYDKEEMDAALINNVEIR